MSEATAPISMAKSGETYPAPGVTAARPTMAPVAIPKTLGRRCIQLRIIQTAAAEAAAALEVTNAVVATPLAPRAEPPLKPNQPNHSRNAPSRTKGILLGSILSLP